MPASKFRKNNRAGFKRPSDDSHENGAKKPKGTPKTKFGRKEMRTVTRTTRRGQHQAEEAPQQQTQGHESSESEYDSDQDGENSSEATMAYNALLTLLKSDHKEERPKKSRKVEVEANDSDDASDVQENAQLVSDDETEAGVISKEEMVADDANEQNQDDPFESHFSLVSEKEIAQKQKFLEDGTFKVSDKAVYRDLGYSKTISTLPLEENTNKSTASVGSLSSYSIKQRILLPFNDKCTLDAKDRMIVDPIFQYQDLLYPTVQHDSDHYQKLYCLHILNHVFKTRDRILKNNSKLAHYTELMASGKTSIDPPEFRDQGYTRPKALILVPTRNKAYEIVEMLIQLSGAEQKENRKKFQGQFFDDSEVPASKPEDFRATFKGNNDDRFIMGLKFTRKSLKLFANFYQSDIIIASPLRINDLIVEDHKPYDFLSSIEILTVDSTNDLEMQNWTFVENIFQYLNKIPKTKHDIVDFSRVKMWYIEDQARYFRQTLVFSKYLTPQISNLVTTKSVNIEGKCKLRPFVAAPASAINKNLIKLKQIYTRFEAFSPVEGPDARFTYFSQVVLSAMIKTTSYEDGLLIYVPDHADAHRVKNFLRDHSTLNFEYIDEYTSQSQLTRARQDFANGKCKALVYTERLHYYRRLELKGVKNILFYAPPSDPAFYSEIIGCIGKTAFREECELDLCFARVLYSKWDALSVERLVGSERVGKLCGTKDEVFEFR
ncbi:hypothetical protein BABINDRAFT_159791 [Babjeviella inositovora NRRL Y-12698]|uniref:U3 small nucleolar RNA-associated protein 25 n=1 Tax=Babjeviella inositovora NRRL Y-12698 TaxID=984486 RepID=A0A1E3QV19_9ASCO|nr:uncharacterized protein BABINDRAFT_159791 [Babjeviella inositovora NRRL Y-12698]ODQ81510.1 hypothetical protein BABINDRAFT_159791 [Babjeviella inositovora NRRL Y-12698]